MEDTIVAIATPLGVGAISIIRVSGKESISIVNSIFKGKDLTKVETHTINYGYIIENNNIIDEVLVSIMKAPKSYTMEDVVEINSHGGIAPTNKVLELLIEKGCRPAEPGEFTKRSFLNGRIDLEEADGIMNLINAKTEKARILSINQVSGKVSEMISNLREDIVKILSNIEVNIDYPEYEDIEVITLDTIKTKMQEIKLKINKILEDSKNGKIINEGIKTSIIGKPNVGKSSILNELLEEDKAIVTDIAGTTRDIVEGKINIDGVLLNIIDTAGIRKTDDIVEKIGVNKSLELIDNSDLILYVLNNNEEISLEDIELLEKIKDKNHIVIINKIDLESKLDLNKINDNNIILHLDNIPSNLVEKIDNVSIIVTTDLPVVSNNADTVEDNKYTWNFDKANYLTKSVSLYIERPKKEEDTKKNNTQKNNNSKSHGPAFTIIIMIGVYLAIIIAVINFFNKKKKLF